MMSNLFFLLRIYCIYNYKLHLFNRILVFGIRSKILISWNRQQIIFLYFMHASGRTINWIKY